MTLMCYRDRVLGRSWDKTGRNSNDSKRMITPVRDSLAFI